MSHERRLNLTQRVATRKSCLHCLLHKDTNGGGKDYLISVLRIASAIHTEVSSCSLDSRHGAVRILNFTFKCPKIVSTPARAWWMAWLYNTSAFVKVRASLKFFLGFCGFLIRCKNFGSCSASFPNWSAGLPQQLHWIIPLWASPIHIQEVAVKIFGEYPPQRHLTHPLAYSTP